MGALRHNIFIELVEVVRATLAVEQVEADRAVELGEGVAVAPATSTSLRPTLQRTL